MAGAHISISVDVEPLAEALQRLLAAAGDLRPVFLDAGEALLTSHRRRFVDQVAPDGTPWAPLSERYRQRKRRLRDRILVLDGHLKDTLRYQASPHELLVGTDRIYGATHQFGRPEARIPARPFLGLSAADVSELEQLIADHLAEAVEVG